MVRVPPHAGARGPAAAEGRDRLRVLPAGHRRTDGRRAGPHDRRAGRRRPHRLQADGGRDPDPRPDHGHLVVRRPDEGAGAAARGGGEAPH